MQPNDQNQQPQNSGVPSGGYVSPSGADVPEYLHMEPVAELKPKKSKKKIIVGVLIFMLVLLFIGAGIGYWWWMKTEPERKFYAALENLMQTEQVIRGISIATKDGAELRVDAVTTFPHSGKPQSKFDYEYSGGEKLPKLNLGGSIILTGGDYFFAKLDKIPNNSKTTDAVVGRWQKINNNDASKRLLYDNQNLASKFNTSLGYIPLGNFSNSASTSLIEYAKSQRTYVVKQVEPESVDGVQTAVYTLEIDGESLESINSKVASLSGIKYESFGFSKISNAKIWINTVSGKIVKEDITNANKTFTLSITLDYSKKESIKEPQV